MSRTVRQHGYGPIGLNMQNLLVSHLLPQAFQTESRGKMRAVGRHVSTMKPFLRVIREVVAELEVGNRRLWNSAKDGQSLPRFRSQLIVETRCHSARLDDDVVI
jgi:hypothetical protein